MNRNGVPAGMKVGPEFKNFGNAGMVGEEGDFAESGGPVKVSGLTSCMGLIIAAKRTTGRERGAVCEGLDVTTLVLFWTAPGTKLKDRVSDKRTVSISLGLRANGEVSVFRKSG